MAAVPLIKKIILAGASLSLLFWGGMMLFYLAPVVKGLGLARLVLWGVFVALYAIALFWWPAVFVKLWKKQDISWVLVIVAVGSAVICNGYAGTFAPVPLVLFCVIGWRQTKPAGPGPAG